MILSYQLPSLRQIIIFKAHGNTGKHKSTKLYKKQNLEIFSYTRYENLSVPLLVIMAALFHFSILINMYKCTLSHERVCNVMQ